MLDNAFYQDAMEGMDLLGTDQVKLDLEDISHRIKNRTQSQKRKNTVIYRIAAAVIVLAILSYTLIFTTDKLDKFSNRETVSQKLEESDDKDAPSTESDETGEEITKSKVAGEELAESGLVGEKLSKSEIAGEKLTESEEINEILSESEVTGRKSTEPQGIDEKMRPSEVTGEKTTEKIDERTSDSKTGEDMAFKVVSPEDTETVRSLDLDAQRETFPTEAKAELSETTTKSVSQSLTDEESAKAARQINVDEETDVLPQFEYAEEDIEESVAEVQGIQESKSEMAEKLAVADQYVADEPAESAAQAAPATSPEIESAKTRKRLSKQKDTRSAGYTPEVSPMKEGEPVSRPEPVNGYDDFEKYISEHLIYPADAFEKRVEGTVVMQFIVKEDSIPSNIAVIQSLSNSCDKEAVRLMEEGPKWIPLISNGQLLETKVRYSIQFKLNK
jgi:TonB family protein